MYLFFWIIASFCPHLACWLSCFSLLLMAGTNWLLYFLMPQPFYTNHTKSDSLVVDLHISFCVLWWHIRIWYDMIVLPSSPIRWSMEEPLATSYFTPQWSLRGILKLSVNARNDGGVHMVLCAEPLPSNIQVIIRGSWIIICQAQFYTIVSFGIFRHSQFCAIK